MASERLYSLFMTGGIAGRLARGGVGSFAIRGSQFGLQLLVVVLLGRVLGPEGYGLYAFWLALATVVAIPAQAGLANVMVRYTAAYQAKSDWARLAGLWRRLMVWGATYGLLAGGVVVGIVLFGPGPDLASIDTRTALWAAAVLLLLPVAEILGGALRGLRYTLVGQIPGFIVRQAAMLVLVVSVLVVAGAGALDAGRAMALQAAALGIVALLAWRLWRGRRPAEVVATSPAFENRRWLRSVLPLSFVGGMMVINSNADVLMLGWLQGNTETGIYRVAAQGAMLVSFSLMAINMVIGPYISRLYTQGRKHDLQKMLAWGTRAIFGVALPVALVFILFGEQILALVFGGEYVPGAGPMAILCAGQLINAAAGSVGFVLNMTGHERDTAKGVGAAAVANLVLNAVLIPPYGMTGAAVATATSMVIWNVLLVWFVYRRTGLNSTVFTLYGLRPAVGR